MCRRILFCKNDWGWIDLPKDDKKKASTLDEMIRDKETEIKRLRELKRKRTEVQFFRGIAAISKSVATKLEDGEPLGTTEKLFRKRLYLGLEARELLSLLIDKIFRRKKAVIFTPNTSS